MKHRVASLIGALVIAALYGPALAQSFLEAADGRHILLVSTAADQIQGKAVILNKRRQGSLMDFEIRVEFDGVPSGKEYQFYIFDAGMKRDGLPPAPVPNASHRFTPDKTGRLEFGFVLDGFSKGEWIQCTLRSSDRSITKTIRFTPFK